LRATARVGATALAQQWTIQVVLQKKKHWRQAL
jgi:hypothetical protein